MPSVDFEVRVQGFCAFCGADEDTDESVVSGFLTVPVVTHAVAAQKICETCLSILLAVVFARAPKAGIGAMVAQAVIEDEQEESQA